MSLRKRLILGLFFSAVLIVVTGSNCPGLWRLYRHGVLTTGQITGLERSNHNTVHYSFTTATGTWNASDQGFPRADQARIGDSVQVYYLPADPSVSLADDPAARLWNELTFVSLAGTVFPLLMVVGLGSRKWSPRSRG